MDQHTFHDSCKIFRWYQGEIFNMFTFGRGDSCLRSLVKRRRTRVMLVIVAIVTYRLSSKGTEIPAHTDIKQFCQRRYRKCTCFRKDISLFSPGWSFSRSSLKLTFAPYFPLSSIRAIQFSHYVFHRKPSTTNAYRS